MDTIVPPIITGFILPMQSDRQLLLALSVSPQKGAGFGYTVFCSSMSTGIICITFSYAICLSLNPCPRLAMTYAAPAWIFSFLGVQYFFEAILLV